MGRSDTKTGGTGAGMIITERHFLDETSIGTQGFDSFIDAIDPVGCFNGYLTAQLLAYSAMARRADPTLTSAAYPSRIADSHSSHGNYPAAGGVSSASVVKRRALILH